MRLVPAWLLLAAVSSAGPRVRFIDRTGSPQDREVLEILEESRQSVRARLPGGEELVVPGTALLDVLRERDTKEPWEKQLWALRRRANAGAEAADLVPALERCAKEAPVRWIREYAAATRALLAERGESGAKVMDAFLKAYPDSRFFGRVVRARARVRAVPIRRPEAAAEVYEEAFRTLIANRISYLEVMLVMRDMGQLGLRRDPLGWDTVIRVVAKKLEDHAPQRNREVWYLCGKSLEQWMELDRSVYRRDDLLVHKQDPRLPMKSIEKISRKDYLLPELQSDALLALGEGYLLLEEREQARIALEAALKVAPDPARRAAAKRVLAKAASPGKPD